MQQITTLFHLYTHSKLRLIVYKCVLYVQDPHEAVVQVRVNGLHVVQGDGFTQQLFVEGESKASVYVVAVEHRHPHDAAHKVKV